MACIRRSAAEVESIVDMRTLLNWCGMSSEAEGSIPNELDFETNQGTPLMSDMQSFLAWTRLSPTSHFRLLAMASKDDFQEALCAGWYPNG